MSRLFILVFFVFALACTNINTVSAQGPTRTRNSLLVYGDIRGGACSTTDASVGVITANTPPETLLFNRTFRGQPNPQFCASVLNPDKSQMSLGQFDEASGRAAVKCIRRGSHSVLHFSGLRPNGVYSIWIVLPDSVPGPPIGVGGLGRNYPFENGFTADADGVGQIGRTTPEQNLSIFGHVGPCMLDSPFALEMVYHADGILSGGDPGPSYTWVVNAAFTYP